MGGGLLYLDFDDLGKSLKCASIDKYKDTFIEYMDANDDELDDLNDWISDMPPSLDGKALFDKDRIENDLLEMSMLTKSESDIIIFRVHEDKNDWKKGWKSYTIYPEMYDATVDNCVAFKISKGCPLIFASELADKGEIIANLTHPSIKQYVTILEIEK